MFSIDKQNVITITKGDDASFRVHLYDNAGLPESINGTLKFTVKSTNQLFQKTSTDGYFTIEHSDTSSATVGFYGYDIQYTTAAGNINTLVKGLFVIDSEVTT